MDATTTSDLRRPGRPRSAEADRAILDATAEEYARCGIDSLSVDAVAARAGVSKATIYRRYPSKTHLVLSAASRLCEEHVTVVDTGAFRDDLRTALRSFARMLAHPVWGRGIRMLTYDASRTDEFAELYTEFTRERRARMAGLVESAVARGELRADTDIEMACDMLAAPMFYSHLVRRLAIDDEYVEKVIDNFLAAYGS